jgi:ubiquinol-cytochrome c reductase iron-sulfur subunit
MSGPAELPDREVRAVRWSVGLLAGAAVAAVGFMVTYTIHDSPQIEGPLLAVALLSIAFAIATWAKALLPDDPHVEDRPPLGASEEQRRALMSDLDRAEGVGRRPILVRAAAAAGLALLAALVVPLRSLGPPPGKAALRTRWRYRVRAVTADGKPVRADQVPVDGLVTMFPEGATDSDRGQAVLIRLPKGTLDPKAPHVDDAAGTLVAFSKVCTHAGCPVGLYQSDSRTLLCPCHQSAFDVTDGAKPLSGPAAWPLPQLPIEVDRDGFVRSTGDLSAPPGPGWWKD